jgi:hypothetical protein
MRCAFGPLGKWTHLKIRFKDRFQNELYRPLYHSIRDGGNPQPAGLAVALGNFYTPVLRRSVTPGYKLLAGHTNNKDLTLSPYVHQPLHTVQLFTREYPNGDRGGNEMCVRAPFKAAPIELHRLWDGVITSSANINRIRNIASDLLRRFSGSIFRELDHPEPESWAKESYEIAVKIAYENGSLRGTPKGNGKDCREVNAVTYVSPK